MEVVVVVVVVGGLGSHGLGKIVFVNVFVVYQRCGALWFGFFVLFVFPKFALVFWEPTNMCRLLVALCDRCTVPFVANTTNMHHRHSTTKQQLPS